MTEPRTHVTWIGENLLNSCRLPEPAFVHKLRGGQPLDSEVEHEACFSDTALDRAAQAGVGLVWVPFFSGWGLEFEKRELERARDFIARAQTRGLKAAALVNLGDLTTETLLCEEPEAHNWLQVNADGHRCGGQTPGTARPCYNSENYLRYLERVCNLAVDYGADLIHFAGLGYNPEPDTCRCPVCVAYFREFLRAQYGAPTEPTRAAGLARFGHCDFTHTRPPACACGEAVDSPHLQEWLKFKARTIAQCLQRLSLAVARRKPECGIGADLFRDFGAQALALNGLSLEEHLPLVDLARCVSVCSAGGGEEPAGGAERPARSARRTRDAEGQMELFAAENAKENGGSEKQEVAEAVFVADRRMLALVRAMKLAGAAGAVFEPGLETGERETLAALGAAFNQGRLGTAGDVPCFPEFCREHQADLLAARPLATAALYYDEASLAFDAAAGRSFAAAADLLLERGIGFDLLLPAQLRAGGRCAALVLTEGLCLSDETAELLEKFVHGGGGLVVLGEVGRRDPWRRQRRGRVLASLFGEEAPPLRREAGGGRVALLPTSPRGGDLVEALRFAANAPLPWTIEVQSGQALSEGARLPDGSLLLQVVRVGGESVRGLRCSLTVAAPPREVRAFVPGRASEVVEVTADNGRIFFSWPALEGLVLFKASV